MSNYKERISGGLSPREIARSAYSGTRKPLADVLRDAKAPSELSAFALDMIRQEARAGDPTMIAYLAHHGLDGEA